MKKIKLLSIIYFILIWNSHFAQINCGTESSVPDILQTIPAYNLKLAPSKPLVVRIWVHIIKKNDCTGGQTQAAVETALNILISDFQSYNICFSLAGIDDVCNTVYYNQFNFTNDGNGDGKFDNFFPNSHSNAIDFYLFPLNYNNYSQFAKASAIGGTAFMVAGDGYTNSKIVSHEMGHCLGLYHTFEGICPSTPNSPTLSCPELVNGINCAECGDYVCDTPADAWLIRWTQDPVTCQVTNPYILSCAPGSTDANGTAYNPDLNQIMSYADPGCMQHFSNGQGLRMQSVIVNSTLLQNILVPDDLDFFNLDVTSGDDFLYDVQNILTAQSDVSVQAGGKLNFRAGNAIDLLPGFEALSGSEFNANIDNQCNTINEKNWVRKANIQEVKVSLEKNEFNLKIFPNPAVDKIEINYYLPSFLSVNISIYDSKGSKISTLLRNRLQLAGNYSIPFSLEKQPKGVFICVIETENINTRRVERFHQKFIIID